eukprot:1855462-Ditylum_brightwellii.AAC.1
MVMGWLEGSGPEAWETDVAEEVSLTSLSHATEEAFLREWVLWCRRWCCRCAAGGALGEVGDKT